jgi:hypothetical protein
MDGTFSLTSMTSSNIQPCTYCSSKSNKGGSNDIGLVGKLFESMLLQREEDGRQWIQWNRLIVTGLQVGGWPSNFYSSRPGQGLGKWGQCGEEHVMTQTHYPAIMSLQYKPFNFLQATPVNCAWTIGVPKIRNMTPSEWSIFCTSKWSNPLPNAINLHLKSQKLTFSGSKWPDLGLQIQSNGKKVVRTAEKTPK